MPCSDPLQALVRRLAGRFLQDTISTLPFSGPCSGLTSRARVFPPHTPELPRISSLLPAAGANIPCRELLPVLASPAPSPSAGVAPARASAPACGADGGARHPRGRFMVIRNRFHVCASSIGPAPSPHAMSLPGLGPCLRLCLCPRRHMADCSRPGCPLPDSDPKAEGSPPGGEQQPQSYPCQLGRLRVRSAVTQCWACRWAGAAAGLNSPGPAASWPGSAVGARALAGKGSPYASPYGCRVSSSPLDAAQPSSRAATGRAAGSVAMGAGGRGPARGRGPPPARRRGGRGTVQGDGWDLQLQ